MPSSFLVEQVPLLICKPIWQLPLNCFRLYQSNKFLRCLYMYLQYCTAAFMASVCTCIVTLNTVTCDIHHLILW